MSLTNFNEFRDLCHSTSKDVGWWNTAERYSAPKFTTDVTEPPIFMPDPDRLTIPTKIALVHTEVREAHDYYLSGDNDDHLPHQPGAAVELGDVTIRVGDTAGYLQIDMDAAISAVRREFSFIITPITPIVWVGNKDHTEVIMRGVEAIMQLHNFAADATEAFRRGMTDEFAKSLARIVLLCDLICERNGWNLLDIGREKVAYNRTRADHKLQVRQAEGGKII